MHFCEFFSVFKKYYMHFYKLNFFYHVTNVHWVLTVQALGGSEENSRSHVLIVAYSPESGGNNWGGGTTPQVGEASPKSMSPLKGMQNCDCV